MKKESELIEIPRSQASEFLSSDELRLVEESDKAREMAYAPYSQFKVGSAALLANGEILRGNNQENAAYPSGLCAERVLLNYVRANHPDQNIVTIGVVTDKSAAGAPNLPIPCGACLQTMYEFETLQNEEFRVILISKDMLYLAEGIKQFLPFRFVL